MSSDDTVDVRIQAEDETHAGFESAKHNVEGFKSAAHELAEEFVGEFARMAAAVLSVEKALEFVKEGIAKADEMRTVQANLEVISKSVDSVTKSMEFFEEAQKRTRVDGLELAKIYADVLPLAIRKGLSEETTRNLTLMFSQISTVLRKAPEEIENSFKMLLSGRISNRNPLLQNLGITAEDIRSGKVGLDELIAKMGALAKKGEELGDTVSSAGGKVKDALLEAFGRGFNEATEATQHGIKDVSEAMTSPRFLETISVVGKTIAYVIEGVGTALKFTANIIKFAFGTIEETIGAILQHTMEGVRKLFELLDKGLTKMGFAGNTAGVKDFMGGMTDYVEGFKGVKNAGADMMAESVTSLDAFIKGEKEAGSASEDLVKKLDKGKDNFSGFGHAARDAAKAAKEALDAYVLSLEKELAVQQAQLDGAESSKAGVQALAAYHKAMAEDLYKLSAGWEKYDKMLKKTGDSPELQHMAELLNQIYLTSEKLADVNLQKALKASLSGMDAEDARRKQESESQALTGMAEIDQRTLEFMRNTVGKSLEQIKAASDTFRKTVQDMFADLATTGGKNFGQIAGQWIASLASTSGAAMGDKFFNAIVGLIAKMGNTSFSGKARQGEDGKWYVDGSDTPYNSEAEANANSKIGRRVQGVMAIAGAGYGAYQSGRANTSGSVTMGAVSGAMAGLTFSYVGAIVGAIVGGLAAAYGKSQARADYKYGIPGVDKSGQAYFNDDKNFTDASAKQVLERVQNTFDTVWNGYVNLLIKIPNSVIPQLKAIDGKFQPNASGHYLENLDAWLTDTLPTEIAGRFKDGMQSAYGSMGMSVDKFNELWKRFDKLDPTKRLQLWNDIADTLNNFADARAILSKRTQVDLPDSSNVLRGPWVTGALQQERSGAFMNQLTQTDSQIMNLATHLKDLTGEAQIAAAKELSQLVLQKAQTEKQALMQLIDFADSIGKSFADARMDRQVRGMVKADGTPDYEAMGKFYGGKAQDILGQLPNITDPQQLAQMAQQYINFINLAEQALANLGPNTAEAARKWADDALQKGADMFQKRIDTIGTAISSSGDKFMTDLDPYLKNITEVTGDLGTTVGTIGSDLDRLHDPLDRLHGKLDDLVTAIDGAAQRINAAQVGGGGGGRGDYGSQVVAQRYVAA